MATGPLISWQAPAHLHTKKSTDWYWSVGIITLALAACAFIFGEVIAGIFILIASATLVIHASHEPKIISYEINDRGVMADDILYPFLTLESFWIPHNESPAKLIIKSRKLMMPYIVIQIDEVDPEEVRDVLVTYIAETEHQESVLVHLLERLGF